jgi:vanillate O-demethylase ferredoxin subunit
MNEMTKAGKLDLVVTDICAETRNIRSVTLAEADGVCLPGWAPGAHIDLELPSGDKRSYSLINTSLEISRTEQPRSYRIGVRREEPSSGGSAFVHGLRVGDRVAAGRPKNNFEMNSQDGKVILLAGGIGITPIMSMAAELTRQGRIFRLIYAGRTRADLAFIPELQALLGTKLEIHEDDHSGILDIASLMRLLADVGSFYVCGPVAMIEAAIETARSLHWMNDRLRFEIFTKPNAVAGDASIEVVLARSGRRFQVPADESILNTLIAHGVEPPHDCKRGDCGMCQVGVMEGIPEHRDYYLSDKERASNKLIQICVSRSKTPVLVLDM